MVSKEVECVIIGAGGHASVLLDCLRRVGGVFVTGLLDSDRARHNTEFAGIRILGGDEVLPELYARGVTDFIIGVGRNGGEDRRRAIYEAAIGLRMGPINVTDPSAIVSSDAMVGAGAQVLTRAVVNAGARIGANVVINTGAIVEHDCVVGNHVFIASGAILGGGVSVAEGVFVGLGAVILPGIAIGSQAVIGAGAVVRERVPAGQKVVGNPARALEDTQCRCV